MKFTYEVGMRVRTREDAGVTGEVIDVEDDEVKVLWDYDKSSNWTEARFLLPDVVGVEHLLAEDNKKIQAKINEAASLLEQAFKAWRLANAMQQGYEEDKDEYFEGAYALRENEDLDLSVFEKVVERNGWSTSSLYC